MSPLDLLLLAAATWYWSYVVTSTHGPGGVFEWMRRYINLGGLLSCAYCLAIWIALALWLLTVYANQIGYPVVVVSAIAGVAMLAHGYSGHRFGG